MYVCIRMYVCIYVCMFVCMYLCLCVYLRNSQKITVDSHTVGQPVRRTRGWDFGGGGGKGGGLEAALRMSAAPQT